MCRQVLHDPVSVLGEGVGDLGNDAVLARAERFKERLPILVAGDDTFVELDVPLGLQLPCEMTLARTTEPEDEGGLCHGVKGSVSSVGASAPAWPVAPLRRPGRPNRRAACMPSSRKRCSARSR